jgi:very low-density lipoprotein receptor
VLHSTDTLRHPFSITTFEDYVYWTDWDKEAVFRANKFNGKDIEPVTALHMASEVSDEIGTEFN